MDFKAAMVRLAKHLTGEITDRRVLEAMARVPRESEGLACEDRHIPIGYGQMISQPYIVALMTENLELTGDEKVLELVSGSGHQTAILAELVR